MLRSCSCCESKFCLCVYKLSFSPAVSSGEQECTFKCLDFTQLREVCITDHIKCDNFPDCADGKDEEDCGELRVISFIFVNINGWILGHSPHRSHRLSFVMKWGVVFKTPVLDIYLFPRIILSRIHLSFSGRLRRVHLRNRVHRDLKAVWRSCELCRQVRWDELHQRRLQKDTSIFSWRCEIDSWRNDTELDAVLSRLV